VNVVALKILRPRRNGLPANLGTGIQCISKGRVRRDFLNKLRTKGEERQARKKQKISTFLPIDAEIMGGNEYKRGCAFLLNWYNHRIAGSDN
jgi:hypothetical protein